MTMKRSRTVQLAFMGTVPLLVTACGGPAAGPRPDERLAYQDVQQCIQDGKVSKETCEQEYQAALQARAQQSHYGNYNDCASQWGDQCRPYVTSSGEHWFIPALTGFMIGRMLGHRDYYYPGPYYGGGGWHGPYRDRPGRGGWDNRPGYGGYGTPPRGPTTAETLSRGGFGYSGAARSSWGG
jgi:uncharacterized protein YgiB involved in biofilm formation